MTVAGGALGPGEVSGLPAHVLLVHAAVVSVPVAALATVVAAAWPAARARLGIATPALALAALVCARLTADAGQWLADRLPPTALLSRHERLGRGLFPWVLALAVVAVLDHVLDRTASREPTGAAAGPGRTATLVRPVAQHRTARTVVAVVLAVVTAAGSLVQVYRVGDSGARAVWSGVLPASDG